MKEEKGPLFFLLAFIALTILFGVLTFLNDREINGASPDQSLRYKIESLKKEIANLDSQAATLAEQVADKRKEISARNAEYDYFKDQRDEYTQEYERRQALLKNADVLDGHAANLSMEVSKYKSQTLAALDGDIRDGKNLMERELADKNKAREDAINRFRALEDDLKTESGKFRQVKNYQQSSLDESKSILSDLTQREIEHANLFAEPDGRVLVSDPVHNTVVVNLGTADGVKNGYRFECYSLRSGNQRASKGYIEVRKAGVNTSDCLIVRRPMDLPKDPLSAYVASEPEAIYSPYQESGKKGASAQLLTGNAVTVQTGINTTDPIVEGDYIINPFFSPGKSYTFYIAGNKDVTNDRQKSAIRYKWTEIKSVIEAYGGKVSPVADINVNFIIAQRNPKEDPEFQKGVELGLPVVYEWELFRFLDTR